MQRWDDFAGQKWRGCVFTILMGDYEALNEQPVAAQCDLDFICLTDNPDLRSASWRIRQVQPLFPQDCVRSQRYLKIKPYALLREYDCSLYIDNSVLLRSNPAAALQSLLDRYELSVFLHSFRETLEAEFEAVLADELDRRELVKEQLTHYRASDPSLLSEKPLWTGMLFRRHRGEALMRFSEIWAAHVLRYSRRDQLSFNWAAKSAGLVAKLINVDNHASNIHSWPHCRSRRQDLRTMKSEDKP